MKNEYCVIYEFIPCFSGVASGTSWIVYESKRNRRGDPAQRKWFIFILQSTMTTTAASVVGIQDFSPLQTAVSERAEVWSANSCIIQIPRISWYASIHVYTKGTYRKSLIFPILKRTGSSYYRNSWFQSVCKTTVYSGTNKGWEFVPTFKTQITALFPWNGIGKYLLFHWFQ